MFYKNYFDRKSIKYKVIKFNKFDELDSYNDRYVMKPSSSPLTYNFDFTSGVLKDGMGVRKLRFKCYPDDTSYKDLDKMPTIYHATACWHVNCFTLDFNTYRSILIVKDSNGDIYYNL